MDSSMSLISAQISFLEGRLALVHIPLEVYPFFLQSILRLLFGEDHDEDASKIPWTDRHKFLNVSITPVECSVVCARELAERYFRPLAVLWNLHANNRRDQVMISKDEFMVVQVEGQGLDAGQRVLELTRPLAMAGISIFFQTTYFSDYILVPAKSKSAVTMALEQRGFTFSADVSAFMHQSQLSPPSSSHSKRYSHSGSIHSLDESLDTAQRTPPSTPPASNVYELQNRTFTRLRRNNIAPSVDQNIRLISCAGRKDDTLENQAKLKDDLLQCLISTCTSGSVKSAGELVPDNSIKFLSLTLTDTEPISLFIESRFLNPPDYGDDMSQNHTLHNLSGCLLGSRETDDYLIPVTLDLRDLPLEATGIVCGVAATLSHDSETHNSPSAVEISFLSTAKAGTVLVRENDLERAVKALALGFERSEKQAAAIPNGHDKYSS